MKKVLLFNTHENLKNMLAMTGCKVTIVAPSQQSATLDRLLAGDFSSQKSIPCAGSFEEGMIVFDGFDDANLDMVLSLLKSAGYSSLLKAIVTPINRQWPAALLYRQLCAERKEMQNKIR